MSGCSNKKFEKKLFAYEIDILSESERRELELHILDCDACRDELKKFKEAALHIRNDETIRNTIKNISEQNVTKENMAPPRGNIWKTIIPIAAAAVIVLMLVLQPWQIEIRPRQDAKASANRLAILWFDNLADKSDSLNMGKIVSNLLITDLAESHYIQVISGQQLTDILNQMGLNDTSQIDNNLSVEIAHKAEASWILTGNILQSEPSFVLTSQIINASTGDIINSQRVESNSGSSIFDVIDQLSIAIKSDLPIPNIDLTEQDRKIADYTTTSTDAYRYYLDGIDYYQKRYYSEAIRSFEQVIENDSTFAMAYYYLAYLKSAKYADKAIEYINNASAKDVYYIKSLEAARDHNVELKESILSALLERYPNEKNALRLLGTSKYNNGKYEEAIGYFEKALRLDPNYKQIHNLLAFAYNKLGDFDKALAANDKYILSAPNEPNPYDSRGLLFAQNGFLDSAIVSYKKALEIKPDFPSSLEELGVLLVFKGEYENAAEYFHKMASAKDKSLRSQGRYYLSLIPLYQGKINEALAVINDCMAADRLEGAESEQGYKHIIKAIIYEGINKPDSAFSEIEKSLEYYKGNYHLYYTMMARNGDIQRAIKELAQLKDSLAESPSLLFQYYLAQGNVELIQGKYIQAIDNLEKAAQISEVLPVIYSLGQAYIGNENYEKAITTYQKVLTTYNSYLLCRGTWCVKMYYFLGVAYEGAGRYNDAIAQYKLFLDILKDADNEIKEIDDARERLNRLNKNI